MEPATVIQICQEAKAVLPSLQNNQAAQQRAIDDLTVKFQALSERKIDNAREMAPTGESVAKFIRPDGGVSLRSGVVRQQFAGKSVDVETEGLFDSAPVDNWHLELLKLAAGRHFARRLLSS